MKGLNIHVMWMRLVKAVLTVFIWKGFLIFFEWITVYAGFYPTLSKFHIKLTVLCCDTAADLVPVL